MATCMRRMRNNNLEIRIVGSSCHLQKLIWNKSNMCWKCHLVLASIFDRPSNRNKCQFHKN